MPGDPQATCCAALVDQWIAEGTRHAVVAPGSRSTPLALALAARSELAVHVLHDERSAAFTALGIGLEGGTPAILLCTSGTAATHFHAAVVEADLSGVPLLACTADRPPELQGIGAPQTIDQRELYGRAVRRYLDPGVPGDDPAVDWRVLARDCWAAATGDDPGPVHLNLAFRDPLVGTPGPLAPPLRPCPGGGVHDHGEAPVGDVARLTGGRGVIVAGRGVDDPGAVGRLAAARGWPVLADPRSRCRALPQAVGVFDALLRVPAFATAMRPEVVLHLGEPPASKVLGQWLAGLEARQVLVHHQPRTIDPLRVLDERVTARPSVICVALAGDAATPVEGWLDGWLDAERAARAVLDECLGEEPALTEPGVARTLTTAGFERLVVASSMPVRDVEWYGAANDLRVLANRGANGIDGVLATAIGAAIAGGGRTAVLLGDVALCHDASSLTALAGRGLDLAIVVVDNDGGGIFSFLPQATLLDRDRFEQLFGTPHGTDIEALAAAHRIPAATARSTAELRAALGRPGTTLVRIPSSRTANVRDHDALHAAVQAAITAAL